MSSEIETAFLQVMKQEIDAMWESFDRQIAEMISWHCGDDAIASNQQSGGFGQLQDYYNRYLQQQQANQYAPSPAPDTIPEIPIAEPPEPEPTPIPQRRVRRCYACARDPHEWPATSRGPGEPAYCEEHRKK